MDEVYTVHLFGFVGSQRLQPVSIGMHVPLPPSILAALVTSPVGSVVNSDTDALHNVERRTPVQVCLPCLLREQLALC